MKKFEIFKSGVVLKCLLAGQSFVVSREKRVCFEGDTPENKIESKGQQKINEVKDAQVKMPEFVQGQGTDGYRATINNAWAEQQQVYLDAKVDLEKEVGKLKKVDKDSDSETEKTKNQEFNDKLEALKEKKLNELKDKLVTLGQARAEKALQFRDSLTKKMIDYRKAQQTKAAEYETKLSEKDKEADPRKPDFKPLIFELGSGPDKLSQMIEAGSNDGQSAKVLSGIGMAIYINQGEQAAQEFLNKLEAEAKKKTGDVEQGYTNEALDAALGKPAMKYLEGMRRETVNLPAAQLGQLIGNMQVAEKMFEKKPELLKRYKNYVGSFVNAGTFDASSFEMPQGPREWALHNAEAELKDLEISPDEFDSHMLEKVRERCKVVKDEAGRKDAEQKIFAHLLAWKAGQKTEDLSMELVNGQIEHYISYSLGFETSGEYDNSMDFQNYKVEKGPGNKDYEKDAWKEKWAVDCVDRFLRGKSLSDENKTAFTNAMVAALRSYADTAWYRDPGNGVLNFISWPGGNNGWSKFLENKWLEWKMDDTATKVSDKTDAEYKKLNVPEDDKVRTMKDKAYYGLVTQKVAGFLVGAEKNFEGQGEIGKKALADYQKYLREETQKLFNEVAALDDNSRSSGVIAKIAKIKSAEEWWNSIVAPGLVGERLKVLEGGKKGEEKKDDKGKGEKTEAVSPGEKGVRAEASTHLQTYLAKVPTDSALDGFIKGGNAFTKTISSKDASVNIPEGFKPADGKNVLAQANSKNGEGLFQILYVSKDQLQVVYFPGKKLDESGDTKKDDKDKKEKGKVEGSNVNAKAWLEKYTYNSADFTDRTKGRAGKYMTVNKPKLDVSKEPAGSILGTKDLGDNGTMQMVVQQNGAGEKILNVLLVPKATGGDKKAEPKGDGAGSGGIPAEVGGGKKKKTDTSADKGDVGAPTGRKNAKEGSGDKAPDVPNTKQQEVARLTHEFVAGGSQGDKKPEDVAKELAAHLNSKNLLESSDSFTYSGVSYSDKTLVVSARNGKFLVSIGADVKRPTSGGGEVPRDEVDTKEKERKITEARNKIVSSLQPKFTSVVNEINSSINQKEANYFSNGNFVKEAIQAKINSELSSIASGLTNEIQLVQKDGFRLQGMSLEYKIDDKKFKTASLNYLCIPGNTTPNATVVLGEKTVG